MFVFVKDIHPIIHSLIPKIQRCLTLSLSFRPAFVFLVSFLNIHPIHLLIWIVPFFFIFICFHLVLFYYLDCFLVVIFNRTYFVLASQLICAWVCVCECCEGMRYLDFRFYWNPIQIRFMLVFMSRLPWYDYANDKQQFFSVLVI